MMSRGICPSRSTGGGPTGKRYYTATLPPGEYQYSYRQNRVLQMQLPFTVRAGEKNVVTVK